MSVARLLTYSRSTVSALFPALFLAAASSSLAQNNYTVFELEREDNWSDLVTEDINGDGARDLIYSNYQSGIGRELFIHFQQDDGSFSATPRRVEIKTEIIAVGFADLREEPGKELLLYASNGVFSLSAHQDGYAGNIKPLLEWDLIAAIPNLERVQFIDSIEDINQDGEIDLLIPGIDAYGFFPGQGNEQFELAGSFTSLNENLNTTQRAARETELDARIAINAEEGVLVELSTETSTPFEGFIEQWPIYKDGDRERDRQRSRSLLRSDRWMPSALLAHMNADGLPDVVYLNAGDDGLGQLNIHYQNSATGFASRADWTGSLDSRGDLQLTDMNNDGLQDLLRLRGDGNEWTARFYLNQDGEFDFEQPDQVMRFSGYDLRLNFIHRQEGEPPLLNASYYTIPVVDAIRNTSINRVQLLYSGGTAEGGQLFQRRPDSSLEESFSASEVRGLSEQMSLAYDVDGDGIKDALYVTENGTLAAKAIDEQLQIAETPFWEYVSPRTVFEFEVLHLNSDDRPDLLLRHGTSTTVLVATP